MINPIDSSRTMQMGSAGETNPCSALVAKLFGQVEAIAGGKSSNPQDVFNTFQSIANSPELNGNKLNSAFAATFMDFYSDSLQPSADIQFIAKQYLSQVKDSFNNPEAPRSITSSNSYKNAKGDWIAHDYVKANDCLYALRTALKSDENDFKENFSKACLGNFHDMIANCKHVSADVSLKMADLVKIFNDPTSSSAEVQAAASALLQALPDSLSNQVD